MFRLLRYFAVASAVVLVAVAVLLYVLYRQTAIENLLDSAEHGNTLLARSLANALWLQHTDRIGPAASNDIDRLSGQVDRLYMDEAIERLSVGLPVLKIKIFNTDGIVVYSTNSEEIGSDPDHRPEYFTAARHGNTASEILYRNDPHLSVSGFSNRDIVETYLPLREPGGEVRGVFELYADVTERFAEIRQVSTALLGGLLGGFAILYGGLLLVVRRAEQIMRSQYLGLRESRERLVEKNTELTAEIARRAGVEAELREAHEGAEAASRAKSLFLANMSHELRTPLNAVIGFSQLMADEVLGRITPQRYREYAEDIQESGRRLLALVNNILDLTKIESGRMYIDLSRFDIHDIVQETVRGSASELEANRNSLKMHCPPDLGTMVSDEIKVRSVLGNVVGNAAKFTSNGRIKVDVTRDDESEDGTGWIIFRVSDTGIGMDERRIEEMFGEFTQHDNSITRKFGGTGLGLAICRRMCEALGGSITIESTLDKGTTVTVRLPDRRNVREIEYRNTTRDTANPPAA